MRVRIPRILLYPLGRASWAAYYCLADVYGALNPDSGVVEQLVTTLSSTDKKKAFDRHAALHVLNELVKTQGVSIMPFVYALLAQRLVLAVDKSGNNVQTPAVETAAAIVSGLNPVSMRANVLLPLISRRGQQAKWQTQVTTLNLNPKVAVEAPHEIGPCMPDHVR